MLFVLSLIGSKALGWIYLFILTHSYVVRANVRVAYRVPGDHHGMGCTKGGGADGLKPQVGIDFTRQAVLTPQGDMSGMGTEACGSALTLLSQ